jgi:hypothetical protein
MPSRPKAWSRSVRQERELPAENPLLLSLIWIVVIVGVFAPLAVRRYRSMSR